MLPRRTLAALILLTAIAVTGIVYAVAQPYVQTMGFQTAGVGFMAGSPVLSPLTPPLACISICNGILITGVQTAAASFFDVQGVTGEWQVLSGPTPTNVTLTTTGVCLLKPNVQDIILPQNTLASLTGIATTNYNYCIFYNTIPPATSFVVFVKYNHP